MRASAAVARVARSEDNDKPTITPESEVRETANRIYQKYGNDLSAFYQDVQRSIKLEKCESQKSKRQGTRE